MLGPIVNPVRPTHQISGVFNLKLLRLYHYILQEENVSYKVLHALDGYDEVSLTGDFKVGSNIGEQVFSPEDFGLKLVKPEDIYGGETIEESVSLFRAIISGQGTASQNAVIEANAGLAIHCLNPHKSIQQCIEEARESLKTGQAKKALSTLINLS